MLQSHDRSSQFPSFPASPQTSQVWTDQRRRIAHPSATAPAQSTPRRLGPANSVAQPVSGSLTSGLCGVLGAVLGAVPHRLPPTTRDTKYLLSFFRYQNISTCLHCTYCTVHNKAFSITSETLVLLCSYTYSFTRQLVKYGSYRPARLFASSPLTGDVSTTTSITTN